MKRSATTARLKKEEKDPKRARSAEPTAKLPEYHETPSRRDKDGEIIWPAPKDQMEAARNFIREWYVQVSTLSKGSRIKVLLTSVS
jgi:ATPase subunit of ABC transporter with duplicated ATPase domains